jgi:hypothetical protein
MPARCASLSASAICAPYRSRQGVALNQLHHQVVGPDVVERADVRMIEGRDRTNLAVETLAKARRADLDGDRTIQALIDGAKHLSHAAGTQQRLHPIDTELPARLQHGRCCRLGQIRIHLTTFSSLSVVDRSNSRRDLEMDKVIDGVPTNGQEPTRPRVQWHRP